MLIRREEIPDLVALFEVLVRLAAAGLDALANDQAGVIISHLKYAALGNVQSPVVLAVVSTLCPRLGEYAAHAFVKINYDPIRVLADNGETREQAARRKVLRDDQALGGFIHINTVREELETNDLGSQSGAGGRLGLRNKGSSEKIILSKAGVRDRQ